MFYYAAKIVWSLAQPSMLLLLGVALGVVLLWTRWARFGRLLALIATVLLFVAGVSPFGHWITWPLEDRFPRADLGDGKPVDGIIVLGGAQDTRVGLARGVTSLNEAGDRLTEAVVLAKRFPEAEVVFSGGNASLLYAARTEAVGAEALLTGMGIDPARLMLEDRSRDTYENALYTKALVKPEPGQRWLLVTSAFHMPRAMGCFRQVGLEVEPWPVDYRTRGPEDWLRMFDKPSEGLRRVDIISREWAGLFVYWLTGRIASPFPAPE